MNKRPADHMPAPTSWKANCATVGDAIFEWNESVHCWIDNVKTGLSLVYDDLTRYGASFWQPVPTPPADTRELTEEEIAKGGTLTGWVLLDTGGGSYAWSPVSNAPVGCKAIWRMRVPIEPAPKVMAWQSGQTRHKYGGPEGYSIARHHATFDNQDDRDRAVKDANNRANGDQVAFENILTHNGMVYQIHDDRLKPFIGKHCRVTIEVVK